MERASYLLEIAMLLSGATALQEQIKRGQEAESFTIEAQKDDGSWGKLSTGTAIGCKRIFAVPETTTDHLRVRFDSYRVAPTITEMGLYC